MLALQKVFLFSLLALLVPQTQTNPKQELNDQLYEAVRKGDPAAVTAALDKGADVNAKDVTNGQTAAMFAAALDRGDAIKVLAEHGANLGITSKVSSSAPE